MNRAIGILTLLAATAAHAAPACMHPSQVPALQVDKQQICWTEIPGASDYDAVVGLSLADLGTRAPTLAGTSLSCLGATRRAPCVAVPFDPPPGDGFWFVVRANRGKGVGTYETGCATERPGRDEELTASVSCP